MHTHIHKYTYTYARVTSSKEIERHFTFLVMFEWRLLQQCQLIHFDLFLLDSYRKVIS